MYIYIPMEIIQLLLFPKDILSIPNYNIFVNYIWCILAAEGRKTTRNIYKYCFFFKKNLSSWERFLNSNHWSYTEVMRKLFLLLTDTFKSQFLVHGAYLVAYDTSLIAKNSKKIIGIQKWRNHSGNADAGEYVIGHHFGILALVGKFLNGRFLSFPLIFRLIAGKSSPCQWICTSDGTASTMDFWCIAHAAIKQFVEWTGKYPVRVVSDSYFSNQSFVKDLVQSERPIHVISKLKSNAVAHEDVILPVVKKRGRPRKRGNRIKIHSLIKTEPVQKLTVQLYGEEKNIEAVVKDLWLFNLNHKSRVVVTRINNRVNAFVCTDLSLTAEQILEIYGSRFSIELAIRDMKQHLGLEDYQHQSLLPTLRFLHLVAVAYSIGRIALLNCSNSSWLNDGTDKGDTPWTSSISFKRLRVCLRRFSMSKLVFSNLALNQEVAENTTVKDAILTIAS